MAVYIFMAENDEYYGSQKARSAYENLLAAYREVGLSGEEIGELLKLEISGNDYFTQRGIRSYYHGGNVTHGQLAVILRNYSSMQ